MEAIAPGDEGREIRSSAQAITEAGSRLERNFRAILDLSKLDAASFTLAPATIRLSELIELQLFEVQPQAERNAIALTCEIEDPDITVTIDEYCLEHALANLLDNAVKFTERGRITVRVYRETEGRICVDVEDTGIGIDSSYLPRLFEAILARGQRPGTAIPGNGPGAGTGETLSRVERSGTVVEEQEGRGQRFHHPFAESMIPRGLVGLCARSGCCRRGHAGSVVARRQRLPSPGLCARRT